MRCKYLQMKMNWHEELRLLNRIQSGLDPMDREWIIAALNQMSLGPSPFASLEDVYEDEKRWVAAAKAEWLDLLLAVFADPPPEEEREHGWQWQTYIFFDEVIRRFPTQAFDKITALLPNANDELRPYLISGLGKIRHPEARVWLQPFVDNMESLPPAELMHLMDTIAADDNQERLQILLRIRAAIPAIQDEEHDEMREDVDGYIANTRKKLEEKGDSEAAST